MLYGTVPYKHLKLTQLMFQVPRGVIHFSFWARNLGLITSLRLGHDNAGLTPNWLVEHVLVSLPPLTSYGYQ